MHKLGFVLIALLSGPSLFSYTFTSTEGAVFDGELARVEAQKVTIKRHQDGKTFVVGKDRFIEADQEYFESWAKANPRQNLPGLDVDRISLSCKSVGSSRDVIYRKTGKTLVDIDVSSSVYVTRDWFDVETVVTASVRDETERVKLKGNVIHVSASSLTGPVHARIYAVFFVKKGGVASIVKVDERNVVVDRGQGEFYSECRPISDYYGFGCVAVNLATGKLIGVDGSTHQIKEILTRKIR